MATSFVEFHGKGFWSHDIFVEGFSYLLAREFDKLDDKDGWQFELIKKWRIAAIAGFSGCVPSYFEEFDTHDKVQLLRKVLVDSITQLENNPDFVTISEMQSGISRNGWNFSDSKRLLKFVQTSLKLVDGQLKSNASTPFEYWDD